MHFICLFVSIYDFSLSFVCHFICKLYNKCMPTAARSAAAAMGPTAKVAHTSLNLSHTHTAAFFWILFSIFTLCLRLFVVSCLFYCVQPLSGQFTTQPKHQLRAVRSSMQTVFLFRFRYSKCALDFCFIDFSFLLWTFPSKMFQNLINLHFLCTSRQTICYCSSDSV